MVTESPPTTAFTRTETATIDPVTAKLHILPAIQQTIHDYMDAVNRAEEKLRTGNIETTPDHFQESLTTEADLKENIDTYTEHEQVLGAFYDHLSEHIATLSAADRTSTTITYSRDEEEIELLIDLLIGVALAKATDVPATERMNLYDTEKTLDAALNAIKSAASTDSF